MAYPHLVLARLYEGIGPMDRGERYEDPLQAVLESAGVGEITGGGSQLAEKGEFEDVVSRLGALAGPESFRGCWQGPEETGVYFFGPDAEAMFSRVEPLLRELPIGQNARVIVRRGKESLGPRTVRMPRH